MIYETEGYLSDFDCKWSIYHDSRRDKKVIRFVFLKDASWNYEHIYDHFLGFVMTSFITTTDGTSAYTVEFHQNICGV